MKDRISDGVRVAELLASEIDGREDTPFADLVITNTDTDVTPTADGAHAYDITVEEETVAEVVVQPERARLVFYSGLPAAKDTASDESLRARTVGNPPRLYVFIPDGVAVKRALPVIAAAVIGR